MLLQSIVMKNTKKFGKKMLFVVLFQIMQQDEGVDA